MLLKFKKIVETANSRNKLYVVIVGFFCLISATWVVRKSHSLLKVGGFEVLLETPRLRPDFSPEPKNFRYWWHIRLWFTFSRKPYRCFPTTVSLHVFFFLRLFFNFTFLKLFDSILHVLHCCSVSSVVLRTLLTQNQIHEM